jgi:hypothetical protein
MANRYWVGGTASWDGNALLKWSTTSGGIGGQAVPTATDDVYFDAASGAVTVTIATASAAVARQIIATGFTGTIAGTQGLTVSGPSGLAGVFTLQNGMTWSNTGTLSFTSTSASTSFTITTDGVSLASPISISGTGTKTLGSALTTTNSCTIASNFTFSTFSLTCLNYTDSGSRTFSFSGSSTIFITGNNATVATFSTTVSGSPPISLSYSGSVGTRTLSVGPASEIFSRNISISAGSDIITSTSFTNFKNLDFTGFSGTVSTWGFSVITIYGNLTLSSGMTYSATATVSFEATSSKTITTNAKTIPAQVTFFGVGGTWTLQDALTTTGLISHTAGTFNTNGKAVTCSTYNGSNSNTRGLTLGASTFTCTGSGASAFTIATTTGMTLTAGTSTISMTSASAKTFAGGGLTYYNLNQGGAGALTISGANTFNDIKNTVQPNTIIFPASTTQTVSNFSLTGTAGNLITINSNSAGTQATLSKSSGTVSCNYLSIKDSAATGGASWYAGTTSTNGGNNTGWIFTAPPVTANTASFFLMFS